MWKKILKYREIAKQIYQVEVKNGRKTSFWYESWSSLGCLQNFLNGGGHIDMSISINATVEESRKHRRRNHRVMLLNKIEDEIEKYKGNMKQEEDVSLWKDGKWKFKTTFSSGETGQNIRERHLPCSWYQAVWFRYATPKYSFILWTALHDRLPTGDRMRYWNGNIDTSCMLCNEPMETREHLFFECSYSTQVWEKLMRGVLRKEFTVSWDNLIRMCTEAGLGKVHKFIIKYAMQSIVYSLWREMNRRRHGEVAQPLELLIKMIEKNLRNISTTIQKKGDKDFD